MQKILSDRWDYVWFFDRFDKCFYGNVEAKLDGGSFSTDERELHDQIQKLLRELKELGIQFRELHDARQQSEAPPQFQPKGLATTRKPSPQLRLIPATVIPQETT